MPKRPLKSSKRSTGRNVRVARAPRPAERGTIIEMPPAVVHPIDRAARLTAEQPILALDAALRAFGDTRGHRSGPDTDHYLDVLGGAILRGSGITAGDGGRPFERVFADTRADALATATLLRLLVLDDHVFDDQLLRSRSIALFDRRVGPRAYSRLELGPKSQTFEKRDALRSAMELHEAALISHVESLHTLTAVPAFRQHLLKLFKDQYTQLSITPFLPPSVSQQLLSEMLGATEACVASDDEHLLLAVDQATQIFDAAEAEVVAFPTSYCESLLGSLQSRLRELLAQHVRERGLADPAKITLKRRAKTFPLRQKGAVVALRLDVSNTGSGHATEVEVVIEGAQLVRFDRDTVRFARLQPGSEEVELRGHVVAAGDSEVILARVSWRNADGSPDSSEELLELTAQDRDTPWKDLEYEQAYSLDPVKHASEFAGRQQLLRELSKIILGSEPGNFTIDGQKRVGKTSLAYALRDNVTAVRPDVYEFLFLECGDFNLNTPEDTLARLGARLCELVKDAEPAARDVDVPDFNKGLAPLTDFFERVGKRAPDRRFIVILDEFDAMPHHELYELGRIGSTFFQSLRSLGGKPNVAFGLIGSERMVSVLNAQEQHVNKFRRIQVDYFTPDQLEDYSLLVREPVERWLDIDDEAVRQLYVESAGNPYITKAIGITLFENAVAACDSDIRIEDVREATAAAVPRLGARAFAHFWDDGISGDPDAQRFISLTRRRVLLALAECLRNTLPLTDHTIIEAASRYEVHSADASEVLRSFRERRILVEAADGALRCRVPVFGRWLADEGVHDIVVTMGDEDAIIRRTRAEEEARIHLVDVEPLATKWSTYRGSAISPERIRDWLRQFGTPSNQRLMLQVLQNLRFYNGDDIRAQLQALHGYVLRDLNARGYDYTFKGRQQVRNDLLVTALDDGGSGAAHLLKPYRDENRIAKSLVVPAADIQSTLIANKSPVRALLILEDFIGTGKTAERRLRRLYEQCYLGGAVHNDVTVYILVIAGFDDGANRVQSALDQLDWNAHLHVANPLDDSDRCFSKTSPIFGVDSDRDAARTLAVDRGQHVAPNQALGHEATEALVVFESRCPNNTLPIIWADNETWTPLFPRH
jgi:hypothetical protein